MSIKALYCKKCGKELKGLFAHSIYSGVFCLECWESFPKKITKKKLTADNSTKK